MSEVVLDPASGSRMFYFDPDDDRVLFGDIRSESHTLCDGRALDVNPDVILDFRSLPFDDQAFKVVVFDPPHLTKVGRNGWMFKKYGGLDVTTWREDLRRGFAECFRVLAPSGVLIFKWNETQIPVSEVLGLTDERPLVGHRRVGKSADTHWITFLKAAHDGCDCTELCEMGATCPGGMVARLPGAGCWRTEPTSPAPSESPRESETA